MDKQRDEFKRLVERADRVQRCRMLLIMAAFVDTARLPPQMQERVELARVLWGRRN